jgi:hypothetical protein
MKDLLDSLKFAIGIALMAGGVTGGVVCGVWGAALLMTWLQKALGL